MALYQPVFLYPNGITIDPSVANTFSSKIQGTVCIAYDLTIRKNSDNSVVYNSTKITLPTPLYNNQTLSITVNSGTLTAGNDYKWRIKLYWDSTNFVESGEIYFKAYSSPTLTLNTIPTTPTINSNNYTFSANFSQSQSIPVKYFTFNLYDANGSLLSTSGKIYSANIQYNFDGLISNISYKVNCVAVDQNDLQANTGVYPFSCSYAEPILNIIPSATTDITKNAVQVKWSNAIQITGQSTGTFSYSNNSFHIGSDEVNINASSTIYYVQNIPEQFTLLFPTILPSGFTGKIVELYDTGVGELYTVGYDGVRFYYIIDGYTHIIPMVLPTTPILIVLRPDNIKIKIL